MTDTARLLLGSDGHGAYGAFATLPGFDATTADPADTLKWAFRSDWPRIENLHQVGRVTGLAGAATSYRQTVMFPALTYIPFVSMRYERGAGTMQDDPWCKGPNPGTDPYMSPYQILVGLDRFLISGIVGSANAPTTPIPPASAVYFVWRIAAGVPT